MNKLKVFLIAILVTTIASSCQIDDLLSVPYGTHELKALDFTQTSFFRPDRYSGDAIITPGECEINFDYGDANATDVEICFPENITLKINRGLTYELQYVVSTIDGLERRSSGGEVQPNEGFLLLDPGITVNGISADRFRIDYTDDELTMYASFRNPQLIFERE